MPISIESFNLTPLIFKDAIHVYLQSVTKYLRLKFEIAQYGKSLISIFQRFFAKIDKFFIFAGGLHTRVSFYET